MFISKQVVGCSSQCKKRRTALSRTATCCPQPTSVMSEPVCVTLASPKGMVYSPPGTSSLTVLYSIFASKNTTGSGSLMADNSRPAHVRAPIIWTEKTQELQELQRQS